MLGRAERVRERGDGDGGGVLGILGGEIAERSQFWLGTAAGPTEAELRQIYAVAKKGRKK